jgi:hypothetical protein
VSDDSQIVTELQAITALLRELVASSKRVEAGVTQLQIKFVYGIEALRQTMRR